jgi:ABC-type nitrate/sulfonate/bicarbonate transport system permease component
MTVQAGDVLVARPQAGAIVVCLVAYGLLGLVTDAAVRAGERLPLRWR